MASLTQPQLDELRRALQRRQAELADQARADPVRGSGDLPVAEVETSPADKATNRLLNDLALEAAGQHLAQLGLIRAALAKMDEGEYGLCEQCGNDIGFARLQARPEAPLCIACQARAEKR
ncbi:MAG TPA: TraR/DksA family transcriptional regulator [Telluria sp.]|nr:TraR/DksA family transcriptional regulator [Telluria sp.]